LAYYIYIKVINYKLPNKFVRDIVCYYHQYPTNSGHSRNFRVASRLHHIIVHGIIVSWIAPHYGKLHHIIMSCTILLWIASHSYGLHHIVDCIMTSLIAPSYGGLHHLFLWCIIKIYFARDNKLLTADEWQSNTVLVHMYYSAQ